MPFRRHKPVVVLAVLFLDDDLSAFWSPGLIERFLQDPRQLPIQRIGTDEARPPSIAAFLRHNVDPAELTVLALASGWLDPEERLDPIGDIDDRLCVEGAIRQED